MSTSDTVYIILFAVCTLLSAYFAAAEVAIVSLPRYKLETMIQNQVKSAKLVAWFKDNPERFFSTILLGNNLVNIAAASLGTALLVGWLGEERGILVSTIVVTIIILVFGDAIPKTSAAHHAGKISTALAPSIRAVSWILTPFVIILSWITYNFGRIFGARPMGRSLVSEEEIRTLITVGHQDGTVEEAEAEMLHKVFEFGDRPVREIMVPRTEIIFIEKGSKIADYLTLYQQHPLNRYPVFHEKRDNVVGIVSSKDILMSLAKGTCDIEQTIDNIIRPALFAPETKRMNEILAEMRDRNYHMCIVIDEYGGVAGLTTLTQLVEEIVGDVEDELGTAEKDFEIINDYTFQIDGTMRIEDVNEEMKLGLPTGDYETVAGFVLKLLGHIPRSGEQLRYRDLKLAVTRMSGMKIEEILVTKERHAETENKVQPRVGT
jgi:putative hemolysin